MSILAAIAAPVKPARKPLAVALLLEINGTVYSVEGLDATMSSARLVKHHDRDGAVYDVTGDPEGNGKCTCTCPDFRARHEGKGTLCKHLAACVEVGLIDPYCSFGDLSAPAIVAAAPVAAEPAPKVSKAERLAELTGRVGAILDGLTALPKFATLARLAECSQAFAKKAVMGRFPANGEVVTIEGIASTAAPCCREPGDDTEAESFADDLLAAVGPAPLAPPMEHDRRFGAGLLDAADLADRPKARRFTLPTPIKPAMLPDGRYDLAGLVDAQAAFLRGLEAAPFTLMARTLADLAASIRHTGAKSVADYEDRIAAMEGGLAEKIAAKAYDAGYADARAELAGCYA